MQKKLKHALRERKLTKHFLTDKRYGDMERAINDKELRKSLLEEYGIQ